MRTLDTCRAQINVRTKLKLVVGYQLRLEGRWAVVVGQLVERSLPTPEIPTSATFYLPIVHLKRKDENKEKVAGNGPSF